MARWFRRRPKQSEADRQWNDEIVPRVTADRADRERRLVGQAELVAGIESLLFLSDPIGINFGDNTDEYRAEAQSITLRLPEAETAALHRIVYEEFVRWFGDAGPESKYAPIAAEIWVLAHPDRPG